MQDLDFSVVLNFRGALLKGLLLTVELTLICGFLSVVFGFLIGVGRKSGPLPVRWLCTTYVEILRGTPVLITLFLGFLLVPAHFRRGIRSRVFLNNRANALYVGDHE